MSTPSGQQIQADLQAATTDAVAVGNTFIPAQILSPNTPLGSLLGNLTGSHIMHVVSQVAGALGIALVGFANAGHLPGSVRMEVVLVSGIMNAIGGWHYAKKVTS